MKKMHAFTPLHRDEMKHIAGGGVVIRRDNCLCRAGVTNCGDCCLRAHPNDPRFYTQCLANCKRSCGPIATN
ncbi:hypothetical protein KTO58_03320 [Chitinophaga pendula]|uniref:hypothetical protein n=1 Tax=Chitinophaga TaxID=79328 RepID=UPI0012FE41F9|nr:MULTISPECIES: hypothetical protein [Chitinophaga]UCJ08230.1 hypothetical protein KTO58_03320 [Chitinophaga pendula]